MDREKSHLITILSKRHGQKDPDVSSQAFSKSFFLRSNFYVAAVTTYIQHSLQLLLAEADKKSFVKHNELRPQI